ncbi:cytosine deaminase [Sinanaerobacter chloroacetimidivorans]|jgi:cytosine deaminase|uniref:Cytosine deaminase n=1 Tax=Sinanaerobacter chloroacetimidivorans TaxID=2818044 RepID=A0A8J7W0U8_9FIRM|nr:cytosine deaminase [Sinanaerobacter chloroacetimidivorans]MBR0597153.1 cytosine deaminase [Sinanaerobacter chloroacetimidivorans]
MSSLLIKNAKLRDRDGFKSILIENGKISKITDELQGNYDEVIDAMGNLVIPPFVDPHVHMDAVLSAGDLSRPNKSGTLLEAIDIWGERKPFLTKDILKENAWEVVKWYVANGVLRVRTHADCSDPTLLTVESLLEIKEEAKDLIDIQVVAFPQDGIFTKPDGEALLRKALEMGADVVGGAPHIEYTREDGVRDVECVYRFAEEFDRLIDIHIDETGDPHSRFVEVMAKENIVRGWQGRAAASHTTAMHNYNNDYAFKLMGILKKAELNMITNPFDNSVLQNRTDGYPRKRGHTRVDELLARGVNVCIGHDSIMDPWYSMGKGNMIAAANLLAHTAHMNGHDQITILMDMITTRSAKTMNIEDTYGIEEGKPADIIILDAGNDAEAVRLTSECLYVIRKGKVISRTTPAVRRLEIGAEPEFVDFKLK